MPEVDLDFFDSHQAIIIFNKVKNRLDKFNFETDNLEVLNAYKRAKSSIAFVSNRLDSSLKIAITDKTLNEMQQILRDMLVYVNQFTSNPNNISPLKSFDTAMDTLYSIIAKIPILVNQNEMQGFSKIINQFSNESETLLNNLKNVSKDIENKFQNLNVRFEEGNRLQDQLNQTIENQKVRLDNSLSKYGEKFDIESKGREERFNAMIERNSTEVDSNIEEVQEELKRCTDMLKQNAKDVISEMSKYKREAKDLLQITANIGITGNYKKTADSDRNWANGFRVGAMIILLVAVGMAIWGIWKLDSSNWEVPLVRLSFAFLLIIPAGYCIAEANKLFKCEQRHRQMELDLASIESFLVDFSPEKRNEIKEKLADRMFGRNESHVDLDKVKDDSIINLGVLNTVIDMIKKLKV